MDCGPRNWTSALVAALTTPLFVQAVNVPKLKMLTVPACTSRVPALLNMLPAKDFWPAPRVVNTPPLAICTAIPNAPPLQLSAPSTVSSPGPLSAPPARLQTPLLVIVPRPEMASEAPLMARV